jgi:hypothetical protein
MCIAMRGEGFTVYKSVDTGE